MQLKHERSQEEIIQELQRQIDELTNTNLSLQDQLARKEQFNAMIAHELRGPLSPIINYAQMLARQMISKDSETEASKRKNAAIQRNTNIIISQARRLTRLVNDLLDASRLTAGQFTLIKEPCDLVALAKETIEYLRPVAPYHQLTLEAQESEIVGCWDAERIQQALGNLLDNAIKYSNEGTTITTRIWSTDDTVHLSVHNQGPGIPSKDVGLLFRPYSRLQTTSGRHGSGLGLYITKSIVESHGGDLRLEPSSDNGAGDGQRGTTFCFDLPLKKA